MHSKRDANAGVCASGSNIHVSGPLGLAWCICANVVVVSVLFLKLLCDLIASALGEGRGQCH